MEDQLSLILMAGYWIAICVTQFIILMILKKVYKTSNNIVLTILLTFLVALILSLNVTYIKNLPITYLIAFVCESLFLLFAFKLTMTQAYLGSCFYVFHVISLKGIIIGTMSLFFKQNSFQILSNNNLKYVSIIVTQVLVAILFLIYYKRMNVKNMRVFLASKKQLGLVLICHLALMVFMLFNSFTFYYNLDLVWISVAQVLTGSILGIAYMVILNYGIDVADLLQHKMRDQNQLDTIQYQLRQQNSLLKIEEILKKFKHDYREQILSVEYCIDNHLYNKAIEELHINYIGQLDSLPQTKKYSNNVILNSLFIDRNDQCIDKDIKMDVLLFFPPYLSLEEKECHEMFRILTENAIEANECVTNRERYLKIKSEVKENWLSIVVENPYEGTIRFEEGRPVSKEEKTEGRGMGLLYIEEMLSESDDMISYKIDKENKIFKVIILLHIDGEGESYHE